MSRSSSGAKAFRRAAAPTEGGGAARPLVAALATPPGRSALAVVRFSGEGLVPFLRKLVPTLPDPLPPRRPILVTVVDVDGDPIDRGLLTLFPAPASYTGEDAAEFSGHGNPGLVERILRSAAAAGARAAEPGEFTLRAYLNGRIDLDEAEAVRDLVEARSRLASRLALERMSGRKGEADLGPLAEQATVLLARLEASLDFSESDGTGEWPEALREVDRLFDGLVDRLRRAERIARKSRGAKVVIAGAPNAGKSFVFNCLCGEDRALVTSVAGTTRDPLREPVEFDGASFLLVDTAGLGPSEDPLERMAAERSQREIDRADLLLVVVDDSVGDVLRRIETGKNWLGDRRGVVVLSKCDEGLEPSEGDGWIATSAVTGFGVDRLSARIAAEVKRIGGDEAIAADWLGEVRRGRLEEAITALEAGRRDARSGLGAEVLAEGVRQACRALGTASGDELSEETLAVLFSSFCIGK